MSVKVIKLVWEIKGLSSSEKLVLLAYADHANKDGTDIWPAVDTIANKTALSRRTVQRVTRKLENMGYLIKDGQHKSGTNLWKISNLKGDMVTPPGVTLTTGGGDIVTPGGVTQCQEGVTLTTGGGDMVTPEPSLTGINRPIEEKNNIPKNLNTKEFVATWKDFKLHRKQIKSPMTPLAESRMLAKLSKETIISAIGMLDQSIENGWKGVFELKNNKTRQAKRLPEGI